MPEKNYCITCNKGGIVMLCDRCQQIFCNKHVIEHRQQSDNQLDDVIQEHDLIQQELRQSSNKHSLLKNIDKWEKESIVKIQTAAETAREELRQMIEDSKERLSTVCRAIVENLRSSREIVKGTDFLNQDLEKPKIYSITKRVLTSDNQERFSKVIGSATIDEGDLLAQHNGQNSTFAYILGKEFYSKGRQTIRFKIEQSQSPYNIFFGCVSSQIDLNKIHYKSPLVAGWFGYNKVYQHGICNTNVTMHGYDTNKIETYDVLSLTFDCDRKQIELFPERTKKIHELSVDIDKAPFPWQFLVILTYENDCVKILYNA